MRMSEITDLLEKVHAAGSAPEASDLGQLLSLEDEAEKDVLFRFADRVRRRHMGQGIYLRGIVEFSSFCSRACAYCGLNRNNFGLKRYRMTADEILAAVGMIVSSGLATVVLQSGEDEGLDPEWLADVVRRVKARFDIAVTLSVGEWPDEAYRLWRDAGADRYLLKIETSDPALYGCLHPGMSFDKRLACLGALRDLGYQTGSGSIVGLKGQTPRHIARDIVFFAAQGFDMIGIGPFIPHPQTALSAELQGDPALTLKAVALTRVVTKTAHIPATTALGSAGGDFRRDALAAGANVLMPNFTPHPYRALYEIYPHKRCVEEAGSDCVGCMGSMAASLGFSIAPGRGDALKKSKKCYNDTNA